jgi:DNA modification methylase
MSTDVEVIHGDCLEVMRRMADASVDAVCTDPPYDLTSGNGRGFMGRTWDGTGIAFRVDLWTEVFRVLKPGGHLLAFGGTRTYHRMTCAIEDAGFEIRDSLHWIYGSGFPKSLNVSKAIDAVAGRIGESVVSLKERLSRHFDASGKTHKQVDDECGFRASNYLTLPADGKRPDPWVNVLPSEEKWTRIKEVLGCPDDSVLEEAFRAAVREVVGQQTKARSEAGKSALPTLGADVKYETWDVTTPATDIAKQWAGFGTALKPSHEPIVLARKPLDGTVAGNVAEHGTGAMNIDGCRIPGHPEPTRFDPSKHSHDGWRMNATGAETAETAATVGGRWPSNLVLTHHPDCRPCGTKRVKGSGGGLTSGSNAFGQDSGWNKHNNLPTEIGRPVDPDGLETVEAWECVQGLCPVAEMDRQSGERVGDSPNRKPRLKRAEQFGWSGDASQDHETAGFTDSGGASRFFPQFSWSKEDIDTVSMVDQIVSSRYHGMNTGGQSCGDESTRDGNTSVGRNPGSNGDNLPTDGCGSRPTDPSPMDARSTTRTKTPSTTTSPTSNVSPASGTTTITSANESTTPSSEESNIDDAVPVCNTSRSENITSGEPGPTADIARNVLEPRSESGNNPTANGPVNFDGPHIVGARKTDPDPRFFPTFAWEADDFVFTPFRYCGKASREERNAGLNGMPEAYNDFQRESCGLSQGKNPETGERSGNRCQPQANHHPTVKPVALVQWLCRLITPPGGLILDCFLGSGTTGVAAIREGFRLIGIEDDPEYIAIAEARIAEARRRLERPHAPAVKVNGPKRRTKTTPLFDLLDEGTDP